MSETGDTTTGLDLDPDESPFDTPPIEGKPFKRGSPEDLAIQRILKWETNEPLGSRSSG